MLEDDQHSMPNAFAFMNSSDASYSL